MIEAELIEKKTAGDYGFFRFKLKESIKPDAGQFIMLKAMDEPVLAKPFSIYSYRGKELTLFVKRVGRLTSKLFSSTVGTVFYIRGPYGVPYIEKINKRRKYILVGGGSGIAPLNFFSELYPDLVYRKLYGFKKNDIRTLFTEKEQQDLIIEEESGKTVVDALMEVYSEEFGVLACGPVPMLKILPSGAYVSLEAIMGCGIGTCKTCAVKTKEGIKFVCKDGPLFRKEEITWEWI